MFRAIRARWHHRQLKRHNEGRADRSSRRTAVATVWIAAASAGAFLTSGFTAWILRNQLSEMRLAERAWLGIDGVSSFNFKAGPGFSVPFDLTNTGKTPALHVIMLATMKSLPKGQNFTATYSPPYPFKNSMAVIEPQMHMELSTLPTDVSPAAYGEIESGRGILYAYGWVAYSDIYGKLHETTFCVMYYKGVPSPVPCYTYNSAN